MVAATEILGYSLAMAEERRACPRDDIVTKLISAEIGGHQLSDDEFGFFVLMLAVAGNETTRNAIAHGMLAFLDHPEQWELFKATRPATAADEIRRRRPGQAQQRTERAHDLAAAAGTQHRTGPAPPPDLRRQAIRDQRNDQAGSARTRRAAPHGRARCRGAGPGAVQREDLPRCPSVPGGRGFAGRCHARRRLAE